MEPILQNRRPISGSSPPTPAPDRADIYTNEFVPSADRRAVNPERRPKGKLAEELHLWPGQVYHGNQERARIISKMGRAINAASRHSLFGEHAIPTDAESAERAWNDGLAILQNDVPAAQTARFNALSYGTEKEQREAEARYQQLVGKAHDLLDLTMGYTIAAGDRGKSQLSLDELHDWQDSRMREMEAMRMESGALESPPIDPIDLATGGIAAGLKSSVGKGFGRAAGRQTGREVGQTLTGELSEEMAEDGLRAMKMPKTDPSLAGTDVLGKTALNGDVFLQPGLPRPLQATTLKHEGVHSFLSPKDGSWLAKPRQKLLAWGYNNSHLLRYAEEALAEGIATRSISKGLRHPVNSNYKISLPRVAAEAGALGAVNAVPWYLTRQKQPPQQK